MTPDDEYDHLSNLCADLLTVGRFEPALVYLFGKCPPAVWVPVQELYAQVGTVEVSNGLAVAWLPSPGNSGFAVLSFFDTDTEWSMSAVYNVARLLKAHPAKTAVA